MILPHDNKLFTVTGAEVRQDGEVIETRGPLLVVHKRLREVSLLLHQPLCIDEKLLER